MIITRAYRTEIYPTKEQSEMLRKTCAAVRFVYNWALCRKIEAYKDEASDPERIKQLKINIREAKKRLKLYSKETASQEEVYVEIATGEIIDGAVITAIHDEIAQLEEEKASVRPKYLAQADLQGSELAALKAKEPWLKEVPGQALLAALQNNDRAYNRFISMVAKEGARPRGTSLRRQPGFMYRWYGAEAVESGAIEYPNLEYYPRFRTTRNGLGGFKFFSKIKVKRRGVVIAGIEGELHLAETDAIPLPPTDATWIDGAGKNAGQWKKTGYFEYLSWTREDNKQQRLPLGERRIASGAITEDRGRWYISVTFTESVPDPAEPSGVDILGVHLGLDRLATLSDGTILSRPSHMAAMEKRLARLNRSLARGRNVAEKVQRRWKQSNDYRERRLEKGELEAHVAKQRKETAHALTHDITSRGAKAIVLHAWGIQGMVRDDGKREIKTMKNGKEVSYFYRMSFAKPILDAAWGMLNLQMIYKSQWKGTRVIVAPQEFPVTQRCCECGEINKEMAKANSPVTFRCPCGNVRHRDDNAAKNLWWYGHSILTEEAATAQSIEVK